MATVNNGTVTAVAAGTTIITATAPDGVKITCSVTVGKKRLVVGYHYSWQGQIDVNTMRWDDLTHLLLAFLYVNADGTVFTGNIHNVKQIVEAAHKNDVKVLASIQHLQTPAFSQVITNHPSTLADNVLNYVRKNNLDGFDIDFEDFVNDDPAIASSLVSFTELIHSKKDPGMIQSCAVHAWDKGYTTKWHEYFDIINIMTYDFAGPWSAEGPTARFELCVERDRDIPNNDQIDHLNYNGKATIVKKTEWAKANNIGGIMIWNVAQDAKSDNESLLKAIESVMHSN